VHEQLLDEARTLIDNDRAAGSPLDLNFDTAYGFVSTLREADQLPLVASKLPGREQGLNNLPGLNFFRLIEASDVVMKYGKPASQVKTARLITELHGARPHFTEIDTKLGIMSTILGVDVEPGAKPIPLQLTERYLQPNSPVEEQQLAANALVQKLRTTS